MTPTGAVEAVCRHYGLAETKVLGRWGAPSMSEPRLVLLVLWRRLGLTFDEMALRMGVTTGGVYLRWKAVQSWHTETADKIMEENDA